MQCPANRQKSEGDQTQARRKSGVDLVPVGVHAVTGRDEIDKGARALGQDCRLRIDGIDIMNVYLTIWASLSFCRGAALILQLISMPLMTPPQPPIFLRAQQDGHVGSAPHQQAL